MKLKESCWSELTIHIEAAEREYQTRLMVASNGNKLGASTLQIFNNITFNRYIGTTGADDTPIGSVARLLLGEELPKDRQYGGVAFEQLRLGTRAVYVRRRSMVVMVIATLRPVLVQLNATTLIAVWRHIGGRLVMRMM